MNIGGRIDPTHVEAHLQPGIEPKRGVPDPQDQDNGLRTNHLAALTKAYLNPPF